MLTHKNLQFFTLIYDYVSEQHHFASHMCVGRRAGFKNPVPVQDKHFTHIFTHVQRSAGVLDSFLKT